MLISNSTNISNFHALEVVVRDSETQLQVGDYFTQLSALRVAEEKTIYNI